MIRLDKYLSDMGIGTRQEVKKIIRQGKVQIDGISVKRPELKIDASIQKVTIEQKEIRYAAYEYYMLYKPSGVVSATEDRRDKTVVELITGKKRKDLFPVGRLDKDTEGLLLLTNDGALAHRLLSPKKHVDKCYYAKVLGEVTEKDIRQFAQGLNIGTKETPELTQPAKLKIITSGACSEIRITIQEGKFHQIKRMFQTLGKEVIYLKRESMGNLVLDPDLKPGEYRRLTKEEIEKL